MHTMQGLGVQYKYNRVRGEEEEELGKIITIGVKDEPYFFAHSLHGGGAVTT